MLLLLLLLLLLRLQVEIRLDQLNEEAEAEEEEGKTSSDVPGAAHTEAYLREMAAKLDALMVLMFEYLDHVAGSVRPDGAAAKALKAEESSRYTLIHSDFSPKELRQRLALPSPNPDKAKATAAAWACWPMIASRSEAADDLFLVLLAIFERSILTTYRSKYIQFLLFYMTRLEPKFSDR